MESRAWKLPPPKDMQCHQNFQIGQLAVGMSTTTLVQGSILRKVFAHRYLANCCYSSWFMNPLLDIVGSYRLYYMIHGYHQHWLVSTTIPVIPFYLSDFVRLWLLFDGRLRFRPFSTRKLFVFDARLHRVPHRKASTNTVKLSTNWVRNMVWHGMTINVWYDILKLTSGNCFAFPHSLTGRDGVVQINSQRLGSPGSSGWFSAPSAAPDLWGIDLAKPRSWLGKETNDIMHWREMPHPRAMHTGFELFFFKRIPADQ